MENDEILKYLVIGLLLMAWWSVRGLIGLFRRHNPILVVCYFIFLFPVAFVHMFFLGVFGKSKKEMDKIEIDREAEIQAAAELKVQNKEN
jgi:hypothetical protein